MNYRRIFVPVFLFLLSQNLNQEFKIFSVKYFYREISFLNSPFRENPLSSGAEHFGLVESQVHLSGRELSQYEYLENRIAFL